MKTLVPYTDLDAGTAAALPDARFAAIDGDDGYRRLLREVWEEGDPFILVEHDVVPTAAQVASLEACPEPWCGYGYSPGDWTPMFGFVRFGRALLSAIPEAFTDPSWPWDQLDAKFAVLARSRGFRWHWHYPHVHHARVAHFSRGEIYRAPMTVAEQIAVAEAEMVSIRAQQGGRPEGSHWLATVDQAVLAHDGTIVLKECFR